MRKLAVIGYPIQHSVSPALQGAALEAVGVEARYGREEVQPPELGAFMAGLRGGGWRGVNVTVPHKQAVIPFLDELSPEAEAIGAVNTVAVEEAGIEASAAQPSPRGPALWPVHASPKGRGDVRLVGHNTDAEGFLRALREDGGFDPAGKRAVLLGAGGAARAVVWALVKGGAGEVCLFNRRLERAEQLAEVGRGWGETRVVAEPWEEGRLAARLAGSQLLVNATSVGLSAEETPLPAEVIPAGLLVFDLIYNPRPSRLLKEAAGRGARTLDGLSMLVYQGAASFEMWTGKRAPVEAMMKAAERAVEKKGSPHPVDLPSGRSTPLPRGEGEDGNYA